jgi:hypothetical protein
VTLRGRLSAWWRPTLTVPCAPLERVAPEPALLAGLPGMLGYADPPQVVVVTSRGAEIPIPQGCRMQVEVFHRILAQIDALPEVDR